MEISSLSGPYIRYVSIRSGHQLNHQVVHCYFTDRQSRHIEVNCTGAITTSNGIGYQTGKKTTNEYADSNPFSKSWKLLLKTVNLNQRNVLYDYSMKYIDMFLNS